MYHLSNALLSLKLGDIVPAAKTFTPFTKLPLELRLKIWKLAAPEPGIFSVFGPWVIRNNTDITIPALRKLPAMLMVNTEARSQALKLFSPLFRYQIGKIVYFDQENDTLYFKDVTAMRLFFTNSPQFERRISCERIKYVAFNPWPICPIGGRPYYLLAYILWQLPYVEEATIIVDPNEAAILTDIDKAKMAMDTYLCLEPYARSAVATYPDRNIPDIYVYTIDELNERIVAGRPKR
jgi:hypothetical protein